MSATAPALQWLRTGREIFPAMLAAIHAARESVRLETYICTDGKICRQFRDALTSAAWRGWMLSARCDSFRRGENDSIVHAEKSSMRADAEIKRLAVLAAFHLIRQNAGFLFGQRPVYPQNFAIADFSPNDLARRRQ